ncbi:MAG: hypothetical protein IIC99_09065 [Chloroflexi bacterium]|nr:hypothetical protein [Chloroflexota bacterium]
MDVIKLLPEYLDMGVDQEEMRQITLAALAQRIREVKLSVAQAVVQARACTLMDDTEAAGTALQQARRLQREYHEFYAQWLGLEGPVAGGLNEKLPRPGKDEGSRGGAAGERRQ